MTTSTRKTVTTEQAAQIASLYQGGTAISAISREHDIPQSSVRLILQRQGVLNVKPNSNAGRPRERQSINDALLNQAVDMVNSGQTLTAISQILNVNPSELSRALAGQGITFTRGRRKSVVQ